MYELMAWLEGSALADFLRGLGIWTYGLLNLGHILGIGSLFGAILLLDLKLMGLWRSIPAASLIRPTVPLAAIGFALAATSGIMMLSFLLPSSSAIVAKAKENQWKNFTAILVVWFQTVSIR